MRALLLDALGTLVALEPPAPRLRRVLADRFGIEASDAQASAAIAAEIAYYRAHLDEGSDASALADLRARCAEALRGALPASERLAAVPGSALTDALLGSLRFSAFGDVLPSLTAAREQGRRVVVVSNWDVSLRQVLGQLGIAPLLDAIVTSAEVGVRKPDPSIFEHALDLVGIEAADAVHVGDSLDEDVAGARRAGVEPILIRRDGSAGPPEVRTIATLADLPPA